MPIPDLPLNLQPSALQIKPNPEREWDILAVYCFLVEIMQMPDWNMRHQQVCMRGHRGRQGDTESVVLRCLGSRMCINEAAGL